MKSPQVKLLLGMVVILGITGWMAYSGIQSSKAYYITTDELLELKDGAFGQRLRVAGYVMEDSMRWEEGKLRFSLSVRGDSIAVVYTGSRPMPDTFREGSQAVVEGEYTRAGLFLADLIQAKCSSKYEAELNSLREGTSSEKHPAAPGD